MISISQSEKEGFLLKLTEEEFRDKVVRRLFVRLNFGDGRDLCGPSEQGKDAIFTYVDQLGEEHLVAVQTKKGAVTMAAKASDSLVGIKLQLQTALQTPFICVRTKRKRFAKEVFLIASGTINEKAREHIASDQADTRIRFMDRDDLIAQIDKHCPEIWLDVLSEVAPYFAAFAKRVEEQSIVPSTHIEVFSQQGGFSAAADTTFTELHLVRPETRLKKERGVVKEDVELKEIRCSELTDIRGERVLVLGDAGSGKSTIAVRVSYLLAKRGAAGDKNYAIPICVKAADLTRFPGDPLGCFIESARKISEKTASPFSDDDLQDGRLIVFADGLDEISSAALRKQAVVELNSFHAKFPKCSVVFLSRPYRSVDGMPELAAYRRYRVSPISLKQAQRMLVQIERGKEMTPATRELMRRLDSIHGMELNPLIVTVFALVAAGNRRDLPANITELFSKFTELMMGRWDEHKGVSLQYQSRVKEHLLARFALSLHSQRRTSFSIEEFREFCDNELAALNLSADADLLISEIIERSGMVRGEPDAMEFRHHLLQEYFAGKGISDHRSIASIVSDEWWRNAIVFYFGGRPAEVEQLLEVATADAIRTEDAFISIGLALQACYLSSIDQRLDVWKWVVDSASRVTMHVLDGAEGATSTPMIQYLQHYLGSRDAVALSGVEADRWRVEDWVFSDQEPEQQRELRRFWYLVALIEIGELGKVLKLVNKHPLKDQRLNTAIHLGCFFVSRVRATPKASRETAEQIMKALDQKTLSVRQQIGREFRSTLLELKNGKIMALEDDERSVD